MTYHMDEAAQHRVRQRPAGPIAVARLLVRLRRPGVHRMGRAGAALVRPDATHPRVDRAGERLRSPPKGGGW